MGAGPVLGRGIGQTRSARNRFDRSSSGNYCHVCDSHSKRHREASRCNITVSWKNLAQQVADDPKSFTPTAHQQALSGNLKAIGMALADTIREIVPIHEEATSAIAEQASNKG
jgi:hypothetical protein